VWSEELNVNKLLMMKKTIFILALAVALAIPAAAQKKTLTIYHTNDTHSTVLPLSPNLADTLRAGRGGYVRRIEMINEAREADKDLLFFDSGDFSQGSPYYTLYKGDVEVGLMNRMGYDAATIGNHEFDFGLDNMARIFRLANFPIVCANYDFTGTVVEGLVKPYIIIKRKGVKIGVFGLSPRLKGLVDDKNYPGVKFLDPTAKAQEMVDLLKGKKKCDIVICLSHLGWWEGDAEADNNVFKNVKGLDLILGGHSHTYMEKLEYVKCTDGSLIPDDQNGKHGIFIGKLKLGLR